MVKNGASSHKTNYMDVFSEILNPEGNQYCCIGSKVTAILLNGWILPTGGVSSGRVCACSLRSRLVKLAFTVWELRFEDFEEDNCLFNQSIDQSVCRSATVTARYVN
jgi:hypothetical protein